jgi:transcription antitermination factor NusG
MEALSQVDLVFWIALIASVFGILEFMRRYFRSQAKEEADHNAIKLSVQEILKLTQDLEEMHKHPDDAGFGVGDVQKDHEVIIGLLKDLNGKIEKLIERRTKIRDDG